MHRIDDYYVAPGVIITGDVVCSAGVNLWYGTVIRGDLSRISLGPRVNIQDGCVIHTDEGFPLEIEEDVVVGHRAVLHGSRIGRGSLIGMGAMLLSACEIGAESLVAAGSIVLEGRKIPPRSVVMGVPGKVVRQLSDDEARRIRETAQHYLDMAERYHRGEFTPRAITPTPGTRSSP
jgi:carbonic anhydrase/acetyltransferase-like protein (isoleucine patch superfamily)